MDGAKYQGSNQSVTTKHLQAKMEIWNTVNREKDTDKLFKIDYWYGKEENKNVSNQDMQLQHLWRKTAIISFDKFVAISRKTKT
jgi:hypothetical protein